VAHLALLAAPPSSGLSLAIPPAATVAPGSTVLVLSSPQTTSLRKGVLIWSAAILTTGFIIGRVSKRIPKKCRPKKKKSRRGRHG
jgi:hypothetical protein